MGVRKWRTGKFFIRLARKVFQKSLTIGMEYGIMPTVERLSFQCVVVGIDCDEGPPVPIPNTEVKLIRADNTCRATCREDR